MQNNKCGVMWQKYLIKNLVFDLCYFIASFRLMFCNAVFKESCDSKESVIEKQNYIF